MEVTINLSEDTINTLKNIINYSKTAGEIRGVTKEIDLEDVIKGAISMYIAWLSIVPTHEILTNKLHIKTNIPEMFKRQGKTQTKVSEITGITKTTLSGIWNGSIPNLENFLKLWLALGKPPLDKVLTITPIE